jgi:hypothetical protein
MLKMCRVIGCCVGAGVGGGRNLGGAEISSVAEGGGKVGAGVGAGVED